MTPVPSIGLNYCIILEHIDLAQNCTQIEIKDKKSEKTLNINQDW